MMASAFVLSGCGDDGDDGPTSFDGNILEFIKSDQFKQSVNSDSEKSFDSLVMYLDKYPDLEALISGSTEYTLFAPSNKAFISLTALPGLKDPDQVNPDIIKGVLAYHIVAGKKMKSDLTAGATITTIFVNPTSGSSAPEAIVVNSDGTLKTGSQNQAIVITAEDQLASNGVVHTTGTVLIPPSTGGQLSAILGTLGATVLLGKDFTYMAYLISLADAGVDAEDTFTAMIAAEGAGLTLLAIPNAVFEGLAKQVLEKESVTKAEVMGVIQDQLGDIARYILDNHVLVDTYVVGEASGDLVQFENGSTVDTYLGQELTVMTGVDPAECSGCVGVVLIGAGGKTAPIFKADVDTEAGISNGVLHVVGGILVPAL
jgi:uncharacterized surface protein with fasciclin (FAS1) repeats